MKSEKILCKGKFGEIGSKTTEFHHETFEGKRIFKHYHDVKNHEDAFIHMKKALENEEFGVLKSMDEISKPDFDSFVSFDIYVVM